MIIRDEAAGDPDAIGAVVTAAFRGMPFSRQTEAAIVDALRRSGNLALSLVTESQGEVVGYIAFSPVDIGVYLAAGSASARSRCGRIVSARE
jgi:putative acetyltransferase